MNRHIILEEAKNLVEQVEESRSKIQKISKENILMKKLLVEKNHRLLEQQEKIEELTRLLVLSDKMLSEMREKIYNKEEKSRRLSEKLRGITENQKSGFLEIKKIIDLREEQIKKLLKEKEYFQQKLVALLTLYEKTKEQLKDVGEKLKEASSKVPVSEDKKLLEEFRKQIGYRDLQIQKIANVFTQSQEKIKWLEDANRKLWVEHEQEKEVLGRIIKRREEEINKLKEFVKAETPPEPKEEKKEREEVVVRVPKTFDPFERKELESMIKIALSYGDSIEKIKESLLNAGYEEEKIKEIIKRV